MIRRLVGVCAAALVLTPGLAQPALAEEGDPVTGWWSRTRLGTPLEAPDTVPDGGMRVSGGPTGRLDVSALRAELAPDVRATALTLEVARSQGTVAVTVCAAAAVWDPVEGGRIEDAPPEDCTLPAQGVVQDGKLLVTLDPASPAGPLDVVLLPTDGAVFSLDLNKPTAAAITVEPVVAELPLPDPAADQAGGPTAGDGAASTELPPLAGVEVLPPPLDAGPVAAAPPILAGALPALPPTSAAAAPSAPAIAAAPPVVLRPVPLAGEAFDPRRHSVPAALLLTLVLAFALRLQAEPVRAPRALGGAVRARAGTSLPVDDAGVPPAPVRGVGRFRRPRPELMAGGAAGQQGVGRFRRDRSEPPVRL